MSVFISGRKGTDTQELGERPCDKGDRGLNAAATAQEHQQLRTHEASSLENTLPIP